MHAAAVYMMATGMEILALPAQTMGPAQEVAPTGTAFERALTVAAHIGGYAHGRALFRGQRARGRF
jgi:hypothetical protein